MKQSEKMPRETLSFPGIQRASGEIEHWLGYLDLDQAEIHDCFRAQNTGQIQQHLNELASKKDLWFQEFLESFLGISDYWVLQVLERDHAQVMRQIPTKITANKSVATFETPQGMKLPKIGLPSP